MQALQIAGYTSIQEVGMDLQILQYAPYQLSLVPCAPNYEDFSKLIGFIKEKNSELRKNPSDQEYIRAKQKNNIKSYLQKFEFSRRSSAIKALKKAGVDNSILRELRSSETEFF